METVRHRDNTFKVDLSNFPKRPSFEEIHTFVHETIGLSINQVIRLQMNHAQNCAHVRCVDLKTALDSVDQHNDQHELSCNGKKVKVRLVMDDGGVEVKIHDLSENISDQEIINYMQQYGEVIGIKELKWGENFAFKGISSGIRIVKMMLRKHIKSFVTIQGEHTLVTYRNQPQTCRHCTNAAHPGTSCVQNRKLLNQKNDLDKRLKNAQRKNNDDDLATAPTYANILGKRSNILMPRFAANLANNSTEPAPKKSVASVIGSNDLTPQQNSAEKADAAIEMLPTQDDHTMPLNETNNSSMTHLEPKSVLELKSDNATCTNEAEKVSVFKTPIAIPPPSTTDASISDCPPPIMDISENDSESSTESSVVTGMITRGRGRPKKFKLDSAQKQPL